MNKANKTSEKIDVVIYIVKDENYRGDKLYKWNLSVKMGEKSLSSNGSDKWKWIAKEDAKRYANRLVKQIKNENPDEVYRKEYTIDCKD